MIVNRTQLADVFGISLPTVDAWKRAGCPVLQHGAKGVAMQFDTKAVAAWRQQVILADATGDKQQDVDEIDRRTKRAKMRQVELEVAKEIGLVAPIRDFERVQAARAAVTRQNIMNVPARAVLQLLGCTDEAVFKATLRKELTLALEQSASADLEITDDDAEDTGS